MSKHFTPDERTKILETIKNSALPIKDASKAYGISVATYYNWQKKHKDNNLNLGKNILPKKRGPKSIKTLTEEVKKEIIALKEKYPYYGVVKISQYLRRHMGIHVTPTKILRFLREENLPFSESYQPKEQKDPIRFEKSHPNDLWSTDIMPYRLKEDGKFYYIGILDDHSRFTLAHGVFKKATEENVISVFSQAVEQYGLPKQVLTDQGTQFHFWNGLTQFEILLGNWGIDHTMARPHNPGCNGKIESFHRNIQRELLHRRYFETVDEARAAIAEYVKYYNFERPHQGIGGLTPADRYFKMEDGVKKYILDPRDSPLKLFATGTLEGILYRIQETVDGGIEIVVNGEIVAKYPSANDLPLAFDRISKLCIK